MNFVSPEEMSKLKARLEDLRKAKIDVQDRITKAAGLGDLSENAEYHFAKEENRTIDRELRELEKRIATVNVVSSDDVPADMVFLGQTVKLIDLSDDTEQLVRIVGEAQAPSADSDILPVSATSPLGEALMKRRVGETVEVRAPRGTLEYKIAEIL
ncbi:MAG: GreA/GreB family elongation factor [Tepidisphaeraceae bacterium]